MWHDHDIDFAKVTAPCNVACGSGIVTVNLPSGSTLHVIRRSGMTCHWIRPNVHHIRILHLISISTTCTAVDMSFCTSLRNFIQIGPPSAEKMTSCRFLEMADLRHLGFLGSNNGFFEKPNYITSYRSSIDAIALNCLAFEKITFFCILATDRRTDKPTASMH